MPIHSALLARLIRLFCSLALLASILPLEQSAALAQAEIPQPRLLKDIYTADDSSSPLNFTPLGDQVIFSAYDSAHGREIWASDGTADGTRILMDLSEGYRSSDPYQLIALNGKVYFTAVDGSYSGRFEIYATDGTPAGTALVWSNPSNGSIQLKRAGDWLYFATSSVIGRIGGPDQAVENLMKTSAQVTVDNFAILQGAVYFSGKVSNGASELFSLNTEGIPVMVKSICPGLCPPSTWSGPGSHPAKLIATDQLLFFVAADADHGTEMWVSDGTPEGTRLLKDIRPGTNGIYPQNSALMDNWLYFSLDDGVHGFELWRSDGLTEHTELVADLAPGNISAMPDHLTPHQSADGSWTLYFTARDNLPGMGHGLELWTLPLTKAGVPGAPALLEIAPGSDSSFPIDLTWLGDTLYFAAQGTPGDAELWETNGQPGGTRQAVDIWPGPDGSAPERMAVLGTRLVFSALDPTNGREPWVSDGTPGGTHLIGNMNNGVDANGSYPTAGLLTNVGGARIRYFVAQDVAHGAELWRTDGTPEGTRMVKDIYPGSRRSLYELEMAEMGGKLYFNAVDHEQIESLWSTDGTTAGTQILYPIPRGHQSYFIKRLVPVGNTLFFIMDDPDSTYHSLWATDGKPGQARQLFSSQTIDQLPTLSPMVALGNLLIFVVYEPNSDSTYQIWRSDGTLSGTQPFLGPFNQSHNYDSRPPFRTTYAWGGQLYFNISNYDLKYGPIGETLWVTNGTRAGSRQIGSTSGDAPTLPDLLTRVGNQLYFSGVQGIQTQVQLWRLPSGSATASPLNVTFFKQPKAMLPLNASTLLVLKYQWTGETFWDAIDLNTITPRRLCYDDCIIKKFEQYTIWQERLYMSSVNQGIYGQPGGLWWNDGTMTVPVPVNNPTTGLYFETPTGLLSANNTLYFDVDDSVHGVEPWIMQVDLDNQVFIPAVSRQ